MAEPLDEFVDGMKRMAVRYIIYAAIAGHIIGFISGYVTAWFLHK